MRIPEDRCLAQWNWMSPQTPKESKQLSLYRYTNLKIQFEDLRCCALKVPTGEDVMSGMSKPMHWQLSNARKSVRRYAMQKSSPCDMSWRSGMKGSIFLICLFVFLYIMYIIYFSRSDWCWSRMFWYWLAYFLYTYLTLLSKSCRATKCNGTHDSPVVPWLRTNRFPEWSGLRCASLHQSNIDQKLLVLGFGRLTLI